MFNVYKINKVGKQEVGIWWAQKHFPRYGVPIWSLWPNIRSLPSIVAEKNSVFGPIRFLLPVCRLCWFYTHWTYILYMPIFSRIFLSNYWWQKSDIWSQASYRYPISWEALSDSFHWYRTIGQTLMSRPGEVYSIQHYVIKCVWQWLVGGQCIYCDFMLFWTNENIHT
jgi:hypothetical protein